MLSLRAKQFELMCPCATVCAQSGGASTYWSWSSSCCRKRCSSFFTPGESSLLW